MKAIFFMFLLCCICCLSCSDEQNTLSEEQNVIENKTFEKVSSLELKQQLLDYLNNSVKTRTTFNNAIILLASILLRTTIISSPKVWICGRKISCIPKS